MRKPLALAPPAALAAVPSAATAQDPFSAVPGGGDEQEDESTPAYRKAVELQRKGRWKEAQSAFRDLLKKYPNTVHAQDVEYRGGENCYLGTVKTWESGPPERRIDVSVMGDGFQISPEDQKLEEAWAKLCLDVLWSDASFSEYRNYFNFYYVRLASKDEGVDKVYTDEQIREMEEKNKKKATKKRPEEFSTALDCKAAGPQRQVMADRDLVYQWLEYANREVKGCGDDGLVIAFARFGELGMGGGGVANVGRPDKSITVHEFGHAFVGLLDEYANNPNSPGYPVSAPNATSDPKNIPWQHFLDRKVKGVGVYEGGATYQKGVWRPAIGCAMNSAGNTGGYCPVCREASVLRIYNYLSPIDAVSQPPTIEMRAVEGDKTQIVVTPMQPWSHDLEVEWYVDRVPDSEPGPQRASDATTDGSAKQRLEGVPGFGGYTGGSRGFKRETWMYDMPPLGILSDLGVVERGDRKKGEATKFVFPVGKLPRGRYQVTVRVWDTTKIGDQVEWVLKDEQRLLEERETWWVTVGPKP